MGLFSFLNKNKQETTAEDSGYYSRAEDDSLATRARSKRAASAGDPARRGAQTRATDPVLPEKKRARRRLVGAIALALAVAIGLPMLLDAEPKPLATDIAFQIPSKEKAAPLPAPAPAAAVSAGDALDQQEEIVAPPPAITPATPSVVPAAAERKVAEVNTAKPEAPRQEAKPEPKAPEPKVAERKPEPKPAEKPAAKPVEKPAEKPAPKKAEDKPSKPAEEGDRALAILEGKAAEKSADSANQKYVLQVAAMATQEKVTELQNKLRSHGISSFTQQGKTASGERVIRVRIGPFSKDEAEKTRARLNGIGLPGSMVPL